MKCYFFSTEDSYDKVIVVTTKLQKTLTNREAKWLVQKLNDGMRLAKAAKACNNLEVIRKNIKMQIPLVQRLIPLLPNADIQLVYKNALIILEFICEELNAGRGSFLLLEYINIYFVENIAKYLCGC